jgi:hypothetical protein
MKLGKLKHLITIESKVYIMNSFREEEVPTHAMGSVGVF